MSINCIVEETWCTNLFGIHFLFDGVSIHFNMFGAIMIDWVMSYMYNHLVVTDSKIWNKEVLGNVTTKKLEALAQLGFWDAKERERAPTVEETKVRRGVVEDLKKWAEMEEMLWRQKSRELWLKKWDKNTSFFHKMANAHRRRNFMAKLRVWRLLSLKKRSLKLYPIWAIIRPRVRMVLPDVLAALLDFVKPEGVDDLKDFRPISLVGELYKLLAKVLANRLKKVTGFLVSDFQHAFVAGRQILDVVLIANKAIDSRIKNNLRGVLCKLDIEKRVETRRSLVSLFILAMETLSCLLSKANEGSFINGFLVRGKNGVGVEVSHLLFANDTLILCDASKENLEYLSWVFMWFEACSWLKINLGKSEMIPIGNVPNLEELVEVLGCKVIVGKYGQEDEGWCTNEERERYGVGVWKALRNGWEDLKIRMRFKVAFSKDARVTDAWDGGSWNPRFIRQSNDWELEKVDIFFERLYDHAISMDIEDSVEWVDTKSSIFLLGPSIPPWLVGEWIISLIV
ncbi:hypothetical protein CK203_062452 [Vitis vinifera]|uniref:Uncharacterized protein n=1 Tax=Vitis vinifera TaxID=29760 RepID=A0A438G6G0_VITVI|nr:hypothetical protein CK203_062452 [Vitis vinifera]